MEQVDKKEIEQSGTPEALYSAIEKSSAESENLSRESAYRESRNALIRFRKVHSKLPALPDHQENAVAGLQEVMDWCIRAIGIIDHMVDDMDRVVIEGFICKLNKLRGLPASGFPKIDKDVWKKAKDRAQRIVDKYQAGKKPPKGLSSYDYCSKRTKFFEVASIISSLADVADRKAGRFNKRFNLLARNLIATDPSNKRLKKAFEEDTERNFYKTVEKIYRLMDSNYTTALAKLEDSINIVYEEWNKLDNTATGDLLDKYYELKKGLKLKDRLDKLVRAYSIDSIVDTALFGTNQGLAFGGEARETIVDSIIQELEEIKAIAQKDEIAIKKGKVSFKKHFVKALMKYLPYLKKAKTYIVLAAILAIIWYAIDLGSKAFSTTTKQTSIPNEKKLLPTNKNIANNKTNKKVEDITLLSLFENDFDNLLRVGEDSIFTDKDGSQTTVKSKLYLDFVSQTKFVGFYIPSVPETFDICNYLTEHYKTALELTTKVMVETSSPSLQPVNTSELKFFGRVFIYHEYPLFEAQKRELFTLYKKHDLAPQFRGKVYLHRNKNNN